MSSACTTAMPEPSMVHSWRVNSMMSLGTILSPTVNSGLAFFLTLQGNDPLPAQFGLDQVLVDTPQLTLDPDAAFIGAFPFESQLFIFFLGFRQRWLFGHTVIPSLLG
jgi:hypothetical protein